MRQFAQLDISRPSKFGVQAKYVDRELHLVDDALAGAVIAGPKFKVAQVIESFDSVDVVHCFFRTQFSTQMLLHYVSVFQHFVGRLTISGRDANHHIRSLLPSGDDRQSVFFSVNFANPFCFALFTAKRLTGINVTGTFSARFIKQYAAVFAFGFMAFVSHLSLIFSEAIRRTVSGVFSVFFAVCGQITRLVEERLLAVFALQFDWRFFTVGAPVHAFKYVLAGFTAEFLRCVFWLNAKYNSALSALKFDRHGVSCSLAGAQ